MMQAVPTRFLPPEDQGYLLGAVIMPDAASLDRTGEVSQHVTDYFMKQPAVSSVAVVDGFSLLDSQNKNNAATFFVGFKAFDERYKSENIETQNARAVLAARSTRSSRRCAKAIILPVESAVDSRPRHDRRLRDLDPEQGRRGDRRSSPASVNDFLAKAQQAAGAGARDVDVQRVVAAAAASNVDRDKAEMLGVPIEEVYSAMQTMFGSLYVSQFNRVRAACGR